MRRPPKVETGWSSRHDVERKLLHDFNNLVTELVFAIQLEESQLTLYYADQLREKYREALIPWPRKRAA